MQHRHLAVIVLALAGCGRLGFESHDVPPDGRPGDQADAAGPLAPLGGMCGNNQAACAPGLTCLASYCNCARAIRSDEYQTCGLRVDGSVYCWGDNARGELGNGQIGGSSLEPVAVLGLSGMSQLDLGAFHACASAPDGALYCWGQIDAEPVKPEPQPYPVPPVVEIAGGGFHACFRTQSREVYCVGRNSAGQLGTGNGQPGSDTAEIVPGLTDVTALSAGGFHTCAIRSDGSLWCWGSDDHGQSSGNPSGQQGVPAPVAGLANLPGVAQVRAGDWHTCALLTDGTVWCWGINDQGQTGDPAAMGDQPVQEVAGLAGIVALYAGDDHNCAVDSEGAVFCWGANSNGQLGLGDTVGPRPATRVSDLEPVVDMALGRRHTCALTRAGAMYCSGRNAQGEHGNGTSDSTASPQLNLFGC